ncbi:MAG: aspartate aminotransferase [Kordiimonas sp.]|nr:aspartate aminotransferase [Kordiimonas sp.]|tara:strand:- start:866 stop:2080 length:1215 start_codon:yes stop_codon:yes gene_type:complete
MSLTNSRLHELPDYPFPRMRALLEDITPAIGPAAQNLSIGEPQHPVPDFIGEILVRDMQQYSDYPPINGTAEWQEAVLGWLGRRYSIPADMMDEGHILPLCGSREGLFSLGLVVIEGAASTRPLALLPNPLYQPYAGAATMAGGQPVYVNSPKENNFQPDFQALPKEVLAAAAMAFICSPANPQGTCADMAYLKQSILLARQYDFVLVGDECYSEIYDKHPPVGMLQACLALVEEGAADSADPFANVVVFNSLSKRSNLAGLRSGFVAGDPKLIAAFQRLRSYGGAPLPKPVYAASAAAWADEGHVTASRALYQQKFDLAEQYLGGRFGFYRPAGGFCLWLNVGDGEEACRQLWHRAGIKVLPGAYLARPDAKGINPGDAYIRVALVHSAPVLAPALEKMADIL